MKEQSIIGSAKVGSRGQIVLPVDIRKKCGIVEGDTMIVIAKPSQMGCSITIIKASEMSFLLDYMDNASSRIRSLIVEDNVSKGKK